MDTVDPETQYVNREPEPPLEKPNPLLLRPHLLAGVDIALKGAHAPPHGIAQQAVEQLLWAVRYLLLGRDEHRQPDVRELPLPRPLVR